MYSPLKISSTWLALAALSLSGCGPSAGDLPEPTGPVTDATKDEAGSSSDSERVSIPVQIILDTEDGLSLNVTAAVSYSISLDSCASGYTETSSTTLAPYKFDKGCIAKLTAFVYDSTDNYNYDSAAAGSTNFSSWAVGQTATFATAASVPAYKKKLKVYVQKQLSDPIATNDAVIYRFSHITAGADKEILKSTIDQNGTAVTVTSVAPPSFTISSATLVNITSGGAGEFQVLLQCSATISGANDDRICAEVDMFDNLRFKLVEDKVANFATASNPTVPELESVFGTAANSGTAIATGDIHDAGGLTTKGGFRTPNTGESGVATGPAQMHLHPNMVLILRSSDPNFTSEFSWQFFNIDINTGG